MWRCTAVLLVGFIWVVNGFDVRLFRRYHGSSVKVDCFDYPEPKDLKYFRHLEAYRTKKPRYVHTTPKYRQTPPTRELSRRADFILSNTDDIVKEHAKLVQDINSLHQVLYIPPLTDDSKDYEDSIFHEILETSTTAMPSTTKSHRSKSGIPIILVGGASQKVHSEPVKLIKQTYNLVGTSVSPVIKHPYPFVTTPTRSPFRVCMATPWSTKEPHRGTRPPSLWQRIVNTIYPR